MRQENGNRNVVQSVHIHTVIKSYILIKKSVMLNIESANASCIDLFCQM